MRISASTDPLNIARGLENLAAFMKSAGFAPAAGLVELAALAAWDDIARVPAASDQRRTRKARAKPRSDASVIPLHCHRLFVHRGEDHPDDDDGPA